MERIYRYDTHVHTEEGSACASARGADMVNAHIKAGYRGMIVTDHFFNGNTAVPENIPWELRVELFVKGFENAAEEAKGKDFDVFFGWEYSLHGTDFLTYGLDKDFLLKHPDILDWPIKEYFHKVHEAGGFISHAHPFREAFYIEELRLFPDHVDAVEVINASHTNPEFNEKALAYAKKHGLIQTSGSDSHHVDGIFGGGIGFYHKIGSIEEFIEALKVGDYILLPKL